MRVLEDGFKTLCFQAKYKESKAFKTSKDVIMFFFAKFALDLY
jgi:hypothetical protein